MTKLLNIEGVTVKTYQIIENIGITIYLDNNNKKAICPDCGKKTNKLHQNHWTTQGVVEGINNKLKLIKRKAYGFRNFDNFILRSFLHWHFAS